MIGFTIAAKTRRLIVVSSLIVSITGLIAVVCAPPGSANGYAAQTTPIPTFTPPPVWDDTYLPPSEAPVFELPPPAPMIDVDNSAITNIVLLGSDSPDDYYRRTDVIVVVSINTAAQTVAMWRIPREMFVYIPGYTLDMINTAFARGAMNDYPGGSFGMIKDMFRYNFGIEIDHYARVNYPDFLELIELMGGLQVSIDCAIEDWKLKSPELNVEDENNWELYTLPIGRYRLQPDTALWYVRSRKSTTELDRGRRQMDVLRAMWQQIRAEGLLDQAATLWPVLDGLVDTDMTWTDMMPLLPLAAELDMAQVARYSGADDVHWMRVYTPDNGREVLLPVRENLLPMLQEFLTPSTANRLGRAQVRIVIADASWYGLGYPQVAADRLAWEGFAALPLDGLAEIQRDATVIYDYTGQTKGSPLPDLQRLLRVEEAHIIRQPNPNRSVDFRVEIGMAYRSCVYSYAEDDLSAEMPESGSPPAASSPSAVCWLRFRAGVNVRLGPGLGYDPFDLAEPDDHFPVLGRSADAVWWQVNDDGEIGWVSAESSNVQPFGSCAGVPVVVPS
jgi:LCP family protein required for cell wall assembly